MTSSDPSRRKAASHVPGLLRLPPWLAAGTGSFSRATLDESSQIDDLIPALLAELDAPGEESHALRLRAEQGIRLIVEEGLAGAWWNRRPQSGPGPLPGPGSFDALALLDGGDADRPESLAALTAALERSGPAQGLLLILTEPFAASPAGRRLKAEWAGRGATCATGTVILSASVPSLGRPRIWNFPPCARSSEPQWKEGLIMTSRPIHERSTPAPVSITTPAPSDPGMHGHFKPAYWPVLIHTSRWLSAAARSATTSSPSAGHGSCTRATAIWLGPES